MSKPEPKELRKKVLIIEDDPDVRKLTEFILQGVFEVISTEDGRSGIEMARGEKPDLILLDIYMAGLTGSRSARPSRVRRIPLTYRLSC